MLLRFFLILIVSLSFEHVCARDDIQAWQWIDLRVYDFKKHKFNLHFENWIADDVKEEKLLFAAFRYKNEIHRHLQLGIHHSYLDIRNLNTDEWSYHQRLEFEFNPKANVHGQLAFMLRNRLEYRWYEDSTRDENFRGRHRPSLTFYTKQKVLTKFYCNSEFFYDYEADKWNEVRTVPIGAGFKVTSKMSLNTFYLIQSKRSKTSVDWQHNHILGTHFLYYF